MRITKTLSDLVSLARSCISVASWVLLIQVSRLTAVVGCREKAAAEERMAVVQAKLDEAQAEFDKAMAHKQALEDDAAATQKKMDSANALIGALAGEEARWSAQSKEFDQTIQQLTGAVQAACQSNPTCAMPDMTVVVQMHRFD